MPTIQSWVLTPLQLQLIKQSRKTISTLVLNHFPQMGTVRLFRVQQSRNKDGPNRILTSPSPQASCLSSLRWQQTAPAFAIFTIQAISSEWGQLRSLLYCTQQETWKKHFPPKSCWVLHLFLDPMPSQRPSSGIEGMNSAHLFHPHGAWTSTEGRIHSDTHSLHSCYINRSQWEN